jgi:uncharacterized membrane protein
MIAANMAAYNYAEPHPFLFRLYGSLAAPTFVLLSGFMVPYNARKQSYGFMYFLLRGASVVLVAALIDTFLWKLFPFTSFDVLYVIGIALPFSYLASKLNKWIHLILSLLFFIATPILQSVFGYAKLPAEVDFSENNFLELWKNAAVAKSFFVEGWFPLFPWMGVALFGSFAGRIRMENETKKGNRVFLITGLSMLAVGITVWVIQNPNLTTRESYSELFYPPTIAYFLTFFGFIFCMIALIQPMSDALIFKFFSVYGRSSLLMYILHTTFIIFIFKPAFEPKTAFVFLQIYLMHALFLWWIALFVQLLKDQVNRLPYLLRFIIGG